MFDKITYISNEGCNIKLKDSSNLSTNLMNLHLIFEDNDKKILGEVDDINGDTLKARFLGEISGNQLIGGNIRKPSLDSNIRIIDSSEIPLITGLNDIGYLNIGYSPLYNQVPIYLNVNSFFSNHFAIFGNTGSGKSCGVSRLFQNMFNDQKLNPYKANIFIFDSSGEYYNAFSNLSTINQSYNYRFISTNEAEGRGEKLRLPIYLLNKDDLALLLQCTSHSQLPIIERMLKLALAFSQNDVDSQAFKNHIIAKAIMTILYTNETAPNKRNEIFSILASCSTNEFNLEAPVQGVGYVRKFRECFLIDNSGNFSESVLLTSYVSSFIKDEYDSYEPKSGVYYNLDTLEKALNFTLISEGWLRNEQTYGDSVTLKVRLHALIAGENAKYFDVKDYVSLETYLSSLLIENGKKYQIVNINLSDIDDEFAKVLTKIYSRLIFDFSKGLKNRGSIPFHIVLEEAHRYIQSDHDRFLFGYNIFERIAKEGRKYGVILGIITQRPVELSDNVISQCTNFLIFKINHPMDIKYIREMVPHITDEIIEKQKSLQPGTCLGFGLGFKIPLIIKMEMPNPSPLSGNCDVFRIWSGDKTPTQNTTVASPIIPVSSTPIPTMPTSSSVIAESVPKVSVVDASPQLGISNVTVDSNNVVAPESNINTNVDTKIPLYINSQVSQPQSSNNFISGGLSDVSPTKKDEIKVSTDIENDIEKPSIPLINIVDSPVINPSNNDKNNNSNLNNSLPKYMPDEYSKDLPVMNDNLVNQKNNFDSIKENNNVTDSNVIDNSMIVDISGESMNKANERSISESEMVDISGEAIKNIVDDKSSMDDSSQNDKSISNSVIDTNKRMINIINDNSKIQNDEENFKNIDEIPQIQNGIISQDIIINNSSNQELNSSDGNNSRDLSTSIPEITDVKIGNNGMTSIDNEIVLDDEDDDLDDDNFDDD